jgi:protease-4
MTQEKKVSFWRIFWPSLTAAAIISLLGLLIWVIVIASLFTDVPFNVKDKTVLHMTLNGDIGEIGETSFNSSTFSVDQQTGLASIIHGLKAAKKDKKVKGVFIELDNLQCGISTAREIRNAINDFEKSGKFVVAYNSGEVVTTGEYYIASAANENYGFPSSNIQFLGLGAELMYFKGLFDKLDMEMQVVRGSNNDFKSAVEPYFRTSMSDSARLQTERYINSIWKEIRTDIASDRGLKASTLDQLADDVSITNVEDAVKHKLIDGAKYRDEVIQIISKKAKTKKGKELELLSFAKYAQKKFIKDQKRFQKDAVNPTNPNIAVILAEGGVTRSGDGLTSDEICKLFKKVREDKSIKTVVFRINSPGGSALASDEIWREVKLTNAKKPVIVSMGDVAASGGYYIAAPATTIFAQPTTITGSIGVFGVIPFTGDMLENKLGLSFDRVGTNKHSVLSTNERLTEEEFARIQKEVDAIYDQFKSRVANGRGMTKDRVNVVGRGRVWTGRDALNIGLVDKLGGLTDAINYAAKQKGIKTTRVKYYPIVKEDKLGALIEQIDDQTSEVKVQSNSLPKNLQEYYEKLKSLESYQGIQMRMPFQIQFK